jgi:drug/metabolite transporter (DMT)-like permease
MGPKRLGAYASVILASIFWGITFVLYKYANLSFRPVSIVFLRLFVSIFFLFGFAILFRRLVKIRKQDLWWFLLMAFFEPFIYFLGEANGMTLVSPTVGAVIVSTIPLLVPFAAYYFFREKLSWLNIAGMIISFSGVLMVIMKKGGGLAASPNGILLMFLAVLAAVGYTMVVRKLLEHYNPISVTAYQSLFGLLMFTPLFLFMELPFPGNHVPQTESILAVLYLGVVGSGICFILLTVAIRELGASKANFFANIVPVVAAVVSFLMLSEPMPLMKILGIGVTILGLLMSQVEGIRRRPSARKVGFRHPPYS